MSRTAFRLLAPLLFAAALCTVPRPATAQGEDPWSKQVTFRVQETPLPQAIQQLAGITGAKIRLTPEAEKLVARTRVTANMETVPLRMVIESLARTAGRPEGKRIVPRFEPGECLLEVVAGPAPPQAPRTSREPGARLISYEGKESTVLEAVTRILDREKIGYRIHPDVRAAMATRRVNVRFENVPLGGALDDLISDLRLRDALVRRIYEPVHNLYVFLPVPEIKIRDLSGVRVNLDVRDEPVRAALRKLFESRSLSYAFSPELVGETPVTSRLTGWTVGQAVDALLGAAGLAKKLGLVEAGGVYSVQPPAPYLRPAEPGAERRETAEFHGDDVRYALKALFGAAGQNYTLDFLVLGEVTAKIDNLPLKEAVETVLKAAKGALPLSYRMVEGVYNIGADRDLDRWK